MHEQEERDLLQQYDDVCVQPNHFFGEHEDMIHDVLCLYLERKS